MNDTLLSLRIKQIIWETTEAITLVLENTGTQAITYQAGQFLTLLVTMHGAAQRRSYSLSSAPGIDQDLLITIKRVTNGEVSRYLIDHVREGQVIQSLPPAGRFTIQTNPEAQRDIFLIGAGSGVTPLFSLLKTVLRAEPKSSITFINCHRNEHTALFWQPINALAAQYPAQLRCIHLFSDPTPDTLAYRGRLTISRLEELVHKNLKFDRQQARFYLCGPSDFMRIARMALTYLQFRGEQIRQEYFVTEPLPAVGVPPQSTFTSQVTVHLGGKSHTFPVQSNEFILKAALERGIQLPYSCQGGRCSACAGICREGNVKMAINEVLTDRDVAAGWTLTCTGYPASGKVEIEIPT